MSFHPHHYRALEKARDNLGNSIIYLQSALERMQGDEWLDAMALLLQLQEAAEELGRLRTEASERFDEFTRHEDFEQMKNGMKLYPDERPPNVEPVIPGSDPGACPECGEWRRSGMLHGCQPPPEPAEFPNALTGCKLVEQHGGMDEALMAYQPDSYEADCIKAYIYLTSGERPKNWVPPVVKANGESD